MSKKIISKKVSFCAVGLILCAVLAVCNLRKQDIEIRVSLDEVKEGVVFVNNLDIADDINPDTDNIRDSEKFLLSVIDDDLIERWYNDLPYSWNVSMITYVPIVQIRFRYGSVNFYDNIVVINTVIDKNKTKWRQFSRDARHVDKEIYRALLKVVGKEVVKTE